MKILLLTKSKKYTCRLLEYLIDHHEVVGVVCKDHNILDNTSMKKICEKHHIKIWSNAEVYNLLQHSEMPKVDLALSNTFGRLIKKDLLEWCNYNCINFHCAILPEYKGLYAYNHGLLNEEKEWGVTAHYVNERFDEGEIIEISKFPIAPFEISVKELEEKAQEAAYKLAIQLIERWNKAGRLPSTPQSGEGHYYSNQDFENAKEVKMTDNPELVERKIHAFWCPPYEGAYIKIGGRHFQLLPENKNDR